MEAPPGRGTGGQSFQADGSLDVKVRRTLEKLRSARRQRLEKARQDALDRGDIDTAHIATRLLQDWSA